MVPQRLQRLLNAGAPDDASVPYRAAAAGCVVISVLAAVMQEAVAPSVGVAAVLLVPAGFVFSYARRGEKNVLLKIILTVGLFVAFAGFLSGVRGATSVDDTRAPLVAVFLWVQVMHSFDVPRARDLTFSVAASVVLIALAGSLAFSTGFLIFVLLHAALLIAALVLAYRAELRRPDDAHGVPSRALETSAPPGARPRRSLLRRGGALALATFVLTSVVFVFLPRFPATQLATLPFSLGGGTNPIAGFTGDVNVPGEGGSSDVGSSEAFDPDNYFGYGESLNLRARGRLSEELVMRVRSPRPTLYRAQAFDRYEDGRWSSSDEDLDEVHSRGLDSIAIPSGRDASPGGEEVVQTFYIDRELPNIVFHAYRPREVYIATTRVRVDDFTSIRTPFTLEKDTIYSVVSMVPERNLDELRFAPMVDPAAPEMQRYLDVPETLGDRFRELSLEITGPHAAPADKAEAVQRWLRQNKTYRLDISRDPPGRDPVEVFVFDREDGFCEQIAATMALMLRASGVPTRIVTGFGEGERNLFTGYWEVRNSDAHAWVEVFYPGAGWVPYDPTFGVPESTAANTTFMLAPLTKVTSSVPAALGVVGRTVSDALRALPGPAWAGATFLLAAFGFGVTVLVRNVRRRARADRTRSDRIVDGWLAVESALAARGVRRAPHETVGEFAARVAPLVGAEIGVDIAAVGATFGEARYGPPGRTDVDDWEARARDAAQAIRRRSKATAG